MVTVTKDFIRAFLYKFAYIDDGFKFKVSQSDVEQFLKEQGSPLSFKEFNYTVSARKKRSTDNKYVYNLAVISNSVKYRVNRARQNKFSDKAIKTLNYYGSKRTWRKEYELLYDYTAHELDCTVMLDACAGSGYLSLLAARTGVFREVILNELSNMVYNYHLTQKDFKAFIEFIYYLDKFGDVEEWIYHVLRGYIKEWRKEYRVKLTEEGKIEKTTEGAENETLEEEENNTAENQLNNGKREYRREIEHADATKAAALAIVKNYQHSGEGGYIGTRMAMCEHIDALKKARLLYKKITLSHWHYRKVITENMNDSHNLIVLDVPYMPETRGQKQSYSIEFSVRQHRNLLQLLTKNKIEARIVLCGYHTSMYEGYFKRYNEAHGEEWHEIKLLTAGSKEEGAEAKERWWVNFDMTSLVEENEDLFEIIW